MLFNQYLIKPLIICVMTVLMSACVAEDNNKQKKPVTLQIGQAVIIDVFKTPSCGCCGKWITHLEDNGFQVIAHNKNDLSLLKKEKGIPAYYQSCHTGVSQDGYVFEGHIPAHIIARFLQDKPVDAIGLTVPAMPVGSPGMEVGDKFMPYDVLMLRVDGTVTHYARVATQKEQY